jgi:hypothetical protein
VVPALGTGRLEQGQTGPDYALADVMLILFRLTMPRWLGQGEEMETPTPPGTREPAIEGAPT